ncbi:MAG: type 11 methyltransferase [Rhodospirillaceae bacterium]|nr:MAG: type 11 methyltransferase [Rhodospirillaceae bacterium]
MRPDRPFQHEGNGTLGPQTQGVFSRLAPSYERMAVLERATGERLLDMLAVGPRDFVLDLGCGPGHLTRRIRIRTNGKLVGVDASAGMIAQARWHAHGSGIIFQVKMAEELDFDRNFNVICQSRPSGGWLLPRPAAWRLVGGPGTGDSPVVLAGP